MRRRLAQWVLDARHWQPEGERPRARKFVLIAYPHTSNWDLLYLLALAEVFDIQVRWLGKHTLFRGPAGPPMRALGGIPIIRHRRENTVQAMARVFDEYESLALTVPAEGTRGWVPHWRSGFYHIARTAGVPIVMGYLDYARRRGGLGPELWPTGDIKRDMDAIRAFYADKVGKYPARAGTVRLREEDASAEGARSEASPEGAQRAEGARSGRPQGLPSKID